MSVSDGVLTVMIYGLFSSLIAGFAFFFEGTSVQGRKSPVLFMFLLAFFLSSAPVSMPGVVGVSIRVL